MSLLGEFVSVLSALDVLCAARVETGIDTRATLLPAPGLLTPRSGSVPDIEILYKTVTSRGTKVELIFSTKVCTLEPIAKGNHVKECSWRVDPHSCSMRKRLPPHVIMFVLSIYSLHLALHRHLRLLGNLSFTVL